MPDWVCPACGGGFPEPIDGMACPWCEFTLGEAAEMKESGDIHALDSLRGCAEETEA
mgnify:CR=1 FL=1